MIIRHTLARSLEGELPTEFKIFDAGVNETSKGPFTFDAAAAASVLATYAREGVSLMIDLEHASISAPDARADSCDARGWADVELRADGSLWAINVTWTPDGARRLSERTQRYISPAFLADKAGRVRSLVNCAIVARPATYDATALVAAAKALDAAADPGIVGPMDPTEIAAALEASNLDPAVLAAVLAMIAPPSEMAAAPDPAVAEMADAPVAAELRRLTGRDTVADALADLVALRARVATIDTERTALDHAQRVELVAALVVLGAETPATAWQGEPTARVPVSRLAAESVSDMRARVAALRAASPSVVRAVPPVAPDVATLSADDAERAAKMTPAQRETFTRLRAGYAL